MLKIVHVKHLFAKLILTSEDEILTQRKPYFTIKSQHVKIIALFTLFYW